MSCPLASIVNPLKDEPNQVMLFYLTQKQSVGLALYDVKKPQPDHDDPEDLVTITGMKTTAFKDNLPAPLDLKIVNPGSFSALKANNMINVYGFVQVAPPAAGSKTIEPAATKRIAQLSPVYKVLLPDEVTTEDGTKTTSQVIGVGMTTIVDAKGQGYMYCLTQIGGAGSACIAEFAVGWSTSKRGADIINTTMLQKPPLATTNLAAAFEPANGGKKSIVYQTKDSLHIVESNGNNDSVIPNTSDGRKGTGLALITATSESTQQSKLYLYYFNAQGQLQRVVRGEDNKWGDSSEKDSTESDANSALTASRVGKWVILHFIDSAGKIKWVRDEI